MNGAKTSEITRLLRRIWEGFEERIGASSSNKLLLLFGYLLVLSRHLVLNEIEYGSALLSVK